MADGDHEPQMFLGELAIAAAGDGVAGRRVSIDVDDADNAVATLPRHADGFADAERHDRFRRPTRVFAGVTGQNALLAVHDVVENRPADGEALGGVDSTSRAAGDGRELARFVIDEHDAAAIGLDPPENEVENAGDELV